MKLTTLLHGVDPAQFRKYSYKTVVRSYMPFMIYLMVVSMGFEYFASRQNLGLALTATFFIFLLMPFAIADKATTAKSLQTNNRGYFTRKRLIEFDDEGMMMRWDSGSYSYTKWTDVEKATHSGDAARIYLTKQQAHMIPDSAWPSTQERDQFLTLLRSKSLL